MTECCICFEKIKNKAKLDSCDHEFCVKCIKRWTKTNTTCPLCRTNITKITGKRKRDTVHLEPTLTPTQRRVRELLTRFALRVLHDVTMPDGSRRTGFQLIRPEDQQEGDITTLNQFHNVLPERTVLQPLRYRRRRRRRRPGDTRENPIVVD
ncbi:MAG: hypothetical protein CMC93_00515 [Flavobacteriaceae bacterium]|nr:hypothetical protein [Flavobacteriaceae bacterium]